MTLFAGGLPEVAVVAGILPVRTTWLTPADVPDTVEGLFEELIVARMPRPRRWQPVTVLDVAELLPPPGVDEDDVHQLWPDPPWWHRAALCGQTYYPKEEIDPLWFGVDNADRPALPQANVLKARAVCDVCPVAPQCLSWALEHDERFGIWGGTTGRQRTQMRKALHQGQVTIRELLAVYG